jgi:mono/diheme cytochrome c family protein
VSKIARAAVLSLSLVAAAAGISAAGDKATKDQIERGKYLVGFVGCHDCHSPKIFSPEGIPSPDPSKLLSGHPAGTKLPDVDKRAYAPGFWYQMSPDLTAFVGPWGTSYAVNLTPDDQTGLGLWTEDIFIASIRTGKHMGSGRPVLPPMPWAYYAQMTDDDLKAVFAYLKSLPPIKNPVPAPTPPPAGPSGTH